MQEVYKPGRYVVRWTMRQTIEIPEGKEWDWFKLLDESDNGGAELVDWEIIGLNES